MISLQHVCCCCWKQTRRRFRWNIAFHVNNHLVCITLPPLLSCHLNCCYRMIKSFVLSFIHSHESENNKNFRRQYFSSIHCMYCTQSSILDLIFVCSPFYRIVVVQFEWCWLVIIITTSEKKIKKNKWIKKSLKKTEKEKKIYKVQMKRKGQRSKTKNKNKNFKAQEV